MSKLSAFFLVLFAFLAARAEAQTSAPNQALINRYCVTCHNQRLKTAKLALDTLDLTHPEKDALAWERAIRKLRGGMMPPPGAARPAAADVQALAGYLETTLDKADAANPNPGSVRIHRLNRAEYSNAMRDLFGLGVDVATLLPNDDISEGFDNIASALKVSPSFLDQYIMAARAMAKQAVGTPAAGAAASTTLRGVDGGIPLPPGARAGVTGRFLAPFEGDYEIRAVGSAVLFTIDGRTADTRGRMHLTAGDHTVIMAGVGRSLVESEGALFGFVPGAAGTGYASTGTLSPGTTAVTGRGATTAPTVTIDGPFDPKGAPMETPNRRKVFLCSPATPADETACASRIVATLARKAFRRPVTDADLAPLMQFYADGRKAGDVRERDRERADGDAVEREVPVSHRAAAGERPAGTIYKLSDLELASRLSFFLWSQHPGRRAADAGRAAQAERAEDARGAGAPHARRSALEDADDELRVPVAARARYGDARPRSVHVSGVRRAAARRDPPRDGAVPRQRVPRRPQRDRSADRRTTRS